VAFQLQALHSPVQLVDAAGKKLGTFVPTVDLSEFEIVGPELTKAELLEAENSSEWYSTDDVLRHLEKLR
jgi:hypothetical protein